jgi:hypothetical protein
MAVLGMAVLGMAVLGKCSTLGTSLAWQKKSKVDSVPGIMTKLE